jgi:hypothetical protein
MVAVVMRIAPRPQANRAGWFPAPGSPTQWQVQPQLLIFDPFVRQHRISSEVAPLLAYLCELQRRHGVRFVVHHARKGGGQHSCGPGPTRLLRVPQAL